MTIHLDTVSEIVLVTALPFFGVTVTETKQDPFSRTFNAVPTILQFFDDFESTLRDTFDVKATFSFTYRANNRAVVDFDIATAGAF